MAKPTIVCVVGTRPEAIKVAPLVLELRRFSEVETLLISTGQHQEMLYSALEPFGLGVDADLKAMVSGQSLAQLTSRILTSLDQELSSREPSLIIGQGDTTTAFVAALLAFYRQVPFAHVEAGLRTTTIDNPFPEEFNRRAAGLVASWHFPPTEWAKNNLLQEGKDPSRVFVTGNTGIDAVLETAKNGEQEWAPDHTGRVLLLTSHRRENWGEPQKGIARAALRLVEAFPDTRLIVPMHKNPAVRETLSGVLAGHPRIELIEPPDYERFVKLMQRSHLILSDSGGVQEEAPAFGIPVLVLRDTTERPEGVHAGTAKLVGADEDAIVREGTRLLEDSDAYAAMANAVSPYGDGKACARIRYILLKSLGIDSPEVPMWSPEATLIASTTAIAEPRKATPS